MDGVSILMLHCYYHCYRPDDASGRVWRKAVGMECGRERGEGKYRRRTALCAHRFLSFWECTVGLGILGVESGTDLSACACVVWEALWWSRKSKTGWDMYRLVAVYRKSLRSWIG